MHCSEIFITQAIECRVPIGTSAWIEPFTLLSFRIWLEHSVENPKIKINQSIQWSISMSCFKHQCKFSHWLKLRQWCNHANRRQRQRKKQKSELKSNDYCIEFNNIVSRNSIVNVNWLRALCYSNLFYNLRTTLQRKHFLEAVNWKC